MHPISIHLFGVPRVLLNGKYLDAGTSKATAVFAFLAVTRQWQTRDTLATLLWPQLDQKHAYAALRTTLWKINKQADAECLEIRRDAVKIRTDESSYVDIWEFQERLKQAGTADPANCPHHAENLCPVCTEGLIRAVHLYLSGFMTGFSLRDSSQFDQWQMFQSEDLRLKAEHALKKLILNFERTGKTELGLQFARQWTEISPMNEEAHQRIIALYISSGQRTAAIQHYREYMNMLGTESRELTIGQFSPPAEPLEKDLLKVVPQESSPLINILLYARYIPSSAGEEYQLPKVLETYEKEPSKQIKEVLSRHGGTVAWIDADGFFAKFVKGTPVSCAIELIAGHGAQSEAHSYRKKMRIFLYASHQDESGGLSQGDLRLGRAVLGASWEGNILVSESALRSTALPLNTVFKNLGLQVYTKGTEPVQVYRLEVQESELVGVERFTRSGWRNNLPAQPTPFIGRTGEVTELSQLLSDSSCRSLTIVGAGGVGKTRLAIEVARHCQDSFKEGVCFVALGPIHTSGLLVPTIASALKFQFFKSKGKIEDDKSQLFSYLREKQLLLVIDNFEHLVEEAWLLNEILENAPRVKILVTSREQLKLRGEWVFPLSGLEFPEREDVQEVEYYASARLFLHGAKRARAGFHLEKQDIPHLAQICRLLHGLPLGLELASALVHTLSLEEIAHGIRTNLNFLDSTFMDVPVRQRSLRVVFDYTWNHLIDQERNTLKKLSIFQGSFSSRMVEEWMDISSSLLVKLSDRSLLRPIPNTERYEMLEVLRMYVAEKLQSSPEEFEESSNMHVDGFAAVLKRKWDDLNGPEQKNALLEMDWDLENYRAAWSWASRNKRIQDLEDMYSALFRYQDIRGRYQEAEEGIDKTIIRLGGGEPDLDTIPEQNGRLIGRLLLNQVWFLRRLGHLDKAPERLFSAGKLLNFYDDPFEVALFKNSMAGLSMHFNQYQLAAALFEDVIEAYRGLGKSREAAVALLMLATITEDPELAEERYKESLKSFRLIGDYRTIGICLNNMAHAALDNRRAEEAKKLAAESQQIAESLGERYGISVALLNLGFAHEMLGEYEEAIRCHKFTLEISTEMGIHHEIITSLLLLGRSYTNSGTPTLAKQHYYLALERISHYPVTFYGELAQTLLGIASLYYHERQQKRAAEIVFHILKHKPAWKQVRDEAEALCASAAASLPARDLKLAQDRGEEQDLNQIIADLKQELMFSLRESALSE
jgi:predicted ATPase/DNA-binding SARP family transcriptional activator